MWYTYHKTSLPRTYTRKAADFAPADRTRRAYLLFRLWHQQDMLECLLMRYRHMPTEPKLLDSRRRRIQRLFRHATGESLLASERGTRSKGLSKRVRVVATKNVDFPRMINPTALLQALSEVHDNRCTKQHLPRTRARTRDVNGGVERYTSARGRSDVENRRRTLGFHNFATNYLMIQECKNTKHIITERAHVMKNLRHGKTQFSRMEIGKREDVESNRSTAHVRAGVNQCYTEL